MLELKISDTLEFRREEGGGGGGERVHDRSLNRVIAHVCERYCAHPPVECQLKGLTLL